MLLLSKLHIGEADVLHGEPLRAKREPQWGEPPCKQHIGEANVLHGEPLRAKRELKWGEPPCERS